MKWKPVLLAVVVALVAVAAAVAANPDCTECSCPYPDRNLYVIAGKRRTRFFSQKGHEVKALYGVRLTCCSACAR